MVYCRQQFRPRSKFTMAHPIWSKILLLGDSLTQGSFDVNNGCWGSLLSHNLQRISDVVPRGFSGYNSRAIKTVLPDLFSRDDFEKAACITILLGSNDCADESSIQHVPKDEFRENIRSIVTDIRSCGVSAEKIILMTPPAYYHEDFVNSLGFDPGLRRPEGYTLLLIDLAKELGVECLDLFRITSDHPDSQKLFRDGLHFNRSGAEVVFNSLWPLIVSRVTQFHSSFEMNLPIWEKIVSKS